VALVAGGGRGIGRAIADVLHAAGATVLATSRDAATAEELARVYGTGPVVLDTRDAASVRAAVAAVTSAHGPVDALVNNAGVNVPKPFLEVTEDDWDLIQDTNVRGVFLLSQAVAAELVRAGRPGSIVTIGSQAGLVAIEDRVPYCTSKSAVIGLTRAMALELAPHQITVNSVAPTFVRTEMTRSTLADPVRAGRLLERIPLGRFAEPSDVTGAVRYLLGPGARMVTGQTLPVDGGWTIW
jgi:NAD(P)-dependent dehydrogenase (short-subunit alcohol dehydrogenase family)